MRASIRFAIAITLSLPAASAFAAALECAAKSGDARVPLLELYTSEGCDSCPPADRWVSELRKQGLATGRVIPLSFHVDYWNHIGWKDPFSDRKYSERQHEISSRNRSTFVYTPQLVLNGKDTRGLQHGNFAGELSALNEQAPGATIALNLNRSDPSRFAVMGDAVVADTKQQENAEIFVALVENDLVTNVKAGENRGKTLHHDFVVREIIGPLKADAKGAVKIDHAFNLKQDWKASDSMLVAFVQNAKTGDVLQALALPACQ